MKRLIQTLLLTAITLLINQHAVAEEVAESTWSGKDIWGTPISLYFAGDGSLAYKTSSGIWTNGSWRIDGSDVYFEMNGAFVENKGIVREGEMSGEGWTKKGYKGNWFLTRQINNLDALVQAKSTVQTISSASAPLLPAEYEGRYEGIIQFDTTSFTMRLSCDSEKKCELETTSVRGSDKPARSVQRTSNLAPVSDWSGVQRAFQYARTNRADKPRNRENAAVQESLRPLLDADAFIDKCIDLNIGGANATVLCRPSTMPWKDSMLLLFGANLGRAGDGFGGYVIYPLVKKSSLIGNQ